MGCGSSTQRLPRPVSNTSREAVSRRASESSKSSCSSASSKRSQQTTKDEKKERKRSSEMNSEKEANHEIHNNNDSNEATVELENHEKEIVEKEIDESNETTEKKCEENEENNIIITTGTYDEHTDVKTEVNTEDDKEKDIATDEHETLGEEGNRVEESKENDTTGTNDEHTDVKEEINTVEDTDDREKDIATDEHETHGEEDNKITESKGNEEKIADSVINVQQPSENDSKIEKKENDTDGNEILKDGETTEKETNMEIITEKDESSSVSPPPAHPEPTNLEKIDGDDEKEMTRDGTDNVDNGYDDVYSSFEEDEEDDEGYTADDLGLMLKSVNYSSKTLDDDKDIRPAVEPGELYTDKEFPLEIAIVQGSSGIEWKRPKEFLSDPKLLSGGVSRYDIGQGSAGTCWFLSTVSVIADKTGMINKIVPKSGYKVEDPEQYDGIFHARFYRFGQWEDIYIDDYLPVIHEKVLWGAKSSTDENEIWVPLLEKAFARLHGSYDAVYGGQPGDAYLQLTGGIGERLDLDNHEDKPVALYRRIKNALSSGSQVTCVVPAEFDDHLGLVGGHAYSLVGVAQVNNTKLISVRNPWGHGEWKGAWSDGSSEWSSVTDNSVIPAKKDNGEFYVSLEDFMKYFSETTICSLTPDFDCDGVSDSLKYITSVFGEWTAEKCGPFGDLLRNPRYTFTVTEEGMQEDGMVPFVVQIIQYLAKRSADHTSMRCDIFKIHADTTTKKGRICAVEIQGTKNNVYTTELQSSFRHKLKPGRYMLIPSTCDGGVERQFLLRLFTPAAVKNVKEMPLETTVLSSENDTQLEHEGKTHSLTFDKTLFGEFINEVNAGGQVSNRDSYSKNPQYVITVPDVGANVPLVIHIMQTQVEPKYPVGFRIFPLDKKIVPPVNVEYLYSNYDNSPSHLEGGQSKFMISWDVDIKYMLPAGRYIGLVHLDLPNTEKQFAVLFKSNTKIDVKGYQTGKGTNA